MYSVEYMLDICNDPKRINEEEKWFQVAQKYVYSSYKTNDLGRVLYNLVSEFKPKRCVELGCLQGYSSIFIAAALAHSGELR